MSLITRCPACATMFKVAADQLEAAQGWVRCGHCGEVFDADLQLVPAEAAGPGALAREPVSFDGVQDAPLQQGDFEPEAAENKPLETEFEEIRINVPPEPQGRQEPVFTTDAYGFKPPSPAEQFQAAAPEIAPFFAEASEATPEVSFVREARRKTLWTSPPVRALLGLMLLVLLAALALQWLIGQKDALAAHEPRLAPVLQALCRPLGCEIRPLRRIESLMIDGASFSKTGPDAYRLTFVFKNTGAVALEIPALEITLTDSGDQALVRRAVLPAQFGATAVALGAHAELAGAISLKVAGDAAQGAGSLPVAGYRIVAFYP